jgi:hypothetical protein
MDHPILLPVDLQLVIPADAVAQELEEKGKAVRRKINRAIQIVGMAKIVELVTKAKEAHGTLLVDNGARPRTLGGCFFYLLRTHLGDKMDLIQPPFKPLSNYDQCADDACRESAQND